MTRQTITTLKGHTGYARTVSFSPDGTIIASGSYDGIVNLWDVTTQQNIATLDGHTDSGGSYSNNPRFISFSPNGTILASGTSDGAVNLWDVTTQQKITTLDGHTNITQSVSFSPDGSILASASDEQIMLWDVATQQNIATLDGYIKGLVSFSPDGSMLASNSNQEIMLWDVVTQQNITTFGKGHTVLFSPDGKTIVSSTGYRLYLWDAETKLEITTFLHTDSIRAISFSPDGTTLAAGTEGNVELWDISGMIQPHLEATESPSIIAEVNADGVINILDLVTIANHISNGTFDAMADVNSDGVVSILDLVLVAGMFEEAAAAPSAQPQVPETLTAVEVQDWLTDARALEIRDPIMKRGFVVLKQLLVSLTPTKTELLSNYPNPFNPETWLPFRLAEDADVTLTIYDVGGRMVRTLDIGHSKAGIYESRDKAIYWDGRNDLGENVASGVYFYHLRAGGYSATRRMVILK